MRYAIISDTHANLEALQAVLADVAQLQVERIVCLGDIVGYHANPAECLAVVRGLDPIWVAGNHDRAVAGQITTAGSAGQRRGRWSGRVRDCRRPSSRRWPGCRCGPR